MTRATEGKPASDQFDQLLMAIVHDARSLLRKSMIGAELIARSDRANLEPHTRTLLDAVIAGNRDLEKFLGRLSDYANALHPAAARPVPLNAVVVAALAGARNGHVPEMQAGEMGEVKVSPALQRVIGELLDNALKFHGAQDPVVRIECSMQETECTIVIRDEGIGIEAEYLESVLEPLVRLHSRDEYPGFGLGLAISRRIVESLGGRLWLQSQPQRGCIASVAIPLNG